MSTDKNNTLELGRILAEVTPEEATSIVEAVRAAGNAQTPHQLLEKMVAGIVLIASQSPDRTAALEVPRRLLELAQIAATNPRRTPFRREDVPVVNPQIERSRAMIAAAAQIGGGTDPRVIVRELIGALVYSCWFGAEQPRLALALVRDALDGQIAKVPADLMPTPMEN